MLIAFMGLPSAGKSSTAHAMGKLLNAQSFLEPEEDKWPQLVKDRELVGPFTALTWFRSARVPNLFSAAAIREKGQFAIVDSYYDKLISLYIEQDCFSWLLPKSDPYFEIALDMAKADYCHLPNADVLIFLRLSEPIWQKFMLHRAREFDVSAELAKNFEMQAHFERAAKTASAELKIKLHIIDQTWSSPDETARRVVDQLQLLS
jgi:deoxyadenosine/deoxycytidine kinase